MEKPQQKLLGEIAKFPDNPGVYFFLDKSGKTIYIGKATSLKSRVRSYFSKDIGEKRSPLIERMVGSASKITFEKTDSVLEALILEAELIKKFEPQYNSMGKDQRSWNYVVITNEEFPRILLVRERNLSIFQSFNIQSSFGPFTNGGQLKEALKIVRKIFPFRDKCEVNKDKPCFNYQIRLCPGTCIGKVTKKEYEKTIKNIILFFRGKKKVLIKNLEKDMRTLAKEREFEKAEEIKRDIFALKHIEDIALIKNNKFEVSNPKFRIEAYDIAHISGTDMVGVMTVVEDGEVKKSDYRMFSARGGSALGGKTVLGNSQANDTAALREVLSRRLKHNEWPLPNLIVVDGAVAQLNASKAELETLGLKIPLVAVTKDGRHRPLKIQSLNGENPDIKKIIETREKEILLSNSEAHRFAIGFHRKLRSKRLRPIS